MQRSGTAAAATVSYRVCLSRPLKIPHSTPVRFSTKHPIVTQIFIRSIINRLFLLFNTVHLWSWHSLVPAPISNYRFPWGISFVVYANDIQNYVLTPRKSDCQLRNKLMAPTCDAVLSAVVGDGSRSYVGHEIVGHVYWTRPYYQIRQRQMSATEQNVGPSSVKAINYHSAACYLKKIGRKLYRDNRAMQKCDTTSIDRFPIQNWRKL